MNDDVRVWARRSSVIQVGDDARVVLLDLDDPAHPPRILTGPAAAVWQAVDGTRDLSTICDGVAEQFELTADEVAGDVRAFLVQLCEDGIIHAAEPEVEVDEHE